MKHSIRKEVPEHLKSLRGDYVSGHTRGRHKEAAENQMLAHFKFILETLDTEEKLGNRIIDVLERAAGEGHDQANLSAPVAREKITEEIMAEFEDLTQPDLNLLRKKHEGELQ